MTVRSCHVSDAGMVHARQLLDQFVRIRSVSNPHSPDYSMDHLRDAGAFVQSELDKLGFDTKIVSIDGSAPYIIAKKICSLDAPTILLYAHYDVQPVDRREWTTLDPFVIEERDGRLYGRGASDDKGGVVAILLALGTLMEVERELPVNVTILVEGEEEYGSDHMGALLRHEAEDLRADALVVMDGGNRDVDTGTLTSSTRGLVNIGIEVKALEKPVHSGVGCLVPDPAQDLALLISSLRDPSLIRGFMDDYQGVGLYKRAMLEESSTSSVEYARDMGVVAGGILRGDPVISIYERIETEPSISVVNMVCGQHGGGNSIQDKATATVGVRITGGQDPDRIARVVIDHLRLCARGLSSGSVSFKLLEKGCHAWKADLNGPLSKAYSSALQEVFPKACVEPCGGALPLLHEFHQVFPEMELIVPGVEDPKCAAHSHDESQDIGLWRRAMDGLIVFLQKARDVVRKV